MALISEARSVTVSYYGSGIETHSSDGTFGMFEAAAVGTPYGGGHMYAYQKSNITPSEITLENTASDIYGPGGLAESNFEVKFSLPQDTRITISGYRNWLQWVSLASVSLGPIPLGWNAPNLNYDQVLGAGEYTLTSFMRPVETQIQRIELHASSVPDGGTSAWMLAIGVLSLVAIRGRTLSQP